MTSWEDHHAWIKNLKVGDKVCIDSRTTFSGGKQVVTVEKVTSLYLFLSDDPKRKWRRNGQRFVGAKGFWIPSLAQWTPAEQRKIDLARMRRTLDGLKWASVPDDEIEGLYNHLEQYL